MNCYLITIEETATGYSAYSPDVPGYVATGRARPEVESEMQGAIESSRRFARGRAADFEAAARQAHEQLGPASPENLDRMLQTYGFSEE